GRPQLGRAIECGARTGNVAPAESQADLEVHPLLGHMRVGNHEDLDDLLQLPPLAERPPAVTEVPERPLLLDGVALAATALDHLELDLYRFPESVTSVELVREVVESA